MSDNPNDQAPITGTEPGQQAGETIPERTFTQADLDRIVKERLGKQESSLLKQIGVTTLDEAKTATAKLKAMDEASKTESERLNDQLKAAEGRVAKAEDDRRKALVKAAVIAEASKPGRVAGDRLEAAYKLLDTSKITVGEDDTVSGIEDAITALLEENAFLKAEEPKKGRQSLGATNPQGTGNADNLDWMRQSRIGGVGNAFGDGGLRFPGDNKR
jgi:hypothetical protein